MSKALLPVGAIGGDVCLGVRAEHVRLGSHGTPGRIRLIEPLGDQTLVFCDYGAATPLVAKVDSERELAVGDHVHMTVNPAGLLFFDTREGKRL